MIKRTILIHAHSPVVAKCEYGHSRFCQQADRMLRHVWATQTVKKNIEETHTTQQNTMQLHRTCKVDNNAPVNCMHTLAHCSPQEAFETTAHEILLVVLLLRNHKQVREPGDDVDSWQSQVDRKSYIAFARPFEATNIYVYHLFARSDTRSPLVLNVKANESSNQILLSWSKPNFLNDNILIAQNKNYDKIM